MSSESHPSFKFRFTGTSTGPTLWLSAASRHSELGLPALPSIGKSWDAKLRSVWWTEPVANVNDFETWVELESPLPQGVKWESASTVIKSESNASLQTLFFQPWSGKVYHEGESMDLAEGRHRFLVIRGNAENIQARLKHAQSASQIMQTNWKVKFNQGFWVLNPMASFGEINSSLTESGSSFEVLPQNGWLLEVWNAQGQMVASTPLIRTGFEWRSTQTQGYQTGLNLLRIVPPKSLGWQPRVQKWLITP